MSGLDIESLDSVLIGIVGVTPKNQVADLDSADPDANAGGFQIVRFVEVT
jgi:hypothetical protein